MSSEMRRPGAVNIKSYVAALDLQLREEAPRVDRRALPGAVLRLVRSLRSILEPILLSGAMVLTSVAVIVAVGAAPASMRVPPSSEAPLATPGPPRAVVTEQVQLRDNLPPEEFLAVAEESPSVQVADNLDMPPMEME
ncbi:MAG: hypothetical protein ACRDZM_07835 [Acidimicrobiia bacterium]